MRGGLPACESRGHGKGAAAVRKEARVGGSGSLRHGRYQLTVDRGGTRVTTTLRVWQKLPLTWRGRWSGGRFLPPAGKRGVDSPELLCQPPGLTWSGSRGCARGTGAQLLCYTGGRVRGLEERWRPEASRAPPCWDPNSIVTGNRMWRAQRATALFSDLPAGDPDNSVAHCGEPVVEFFSARGEERNF